MWPNPQETEEILNEKFDFCAVGLREIIWNSQKQSSEVLYKKSVLKNFAKFTGKHLFYRALLGKCFWIVRRECVPLDDFNIYVKLL